MIHEVRMTKSAEKDLAKAPENVQLIFDQWLEDVADDGLEEVRKLPGWHDEPLKGKLKGIRSIRLGRKWRAFYVEKEDGTIRFVEVKEINPHDYR